MTDEVRARASVDPGSSDGSSSEGGLSDGGATSSGPFWRRGLWLENPALVQLLGLCPLLAVTTSVVNAVGLGVATLFALVVLSTCVSATRRWVQPDVRLPIYVLILASAVTMVDLAMHAWAFELHERLGIFVPLIVTNCAVLGRAESFARRHSVRESFWDAVSMGLGFGIVLCVLGALREAFGAGTLFAQAESLFGPSAASWELPVVDGQGLGILASPPGAFFGLALIALIVKALTQRAARARRGV